MYKDYEIKLNAILDRQKSVKRFDFKDIKTLEKLTNELSKVSSNLDKAAENVKSSVKVYEVKNKANKEAIKKQDLAFVKLKEQEKKILEEQKELAKIDKEYDKLEKAQDKTRLQKEKLAQSVFKQEEKYETNYTKGESISSKLETAIKEVEKISKGLGINVPLEKYKQTLKTFDNTPRDAFQGVDFDY